MNEFWLQQTSRSDMSFRGPLTFSGWAHIREILQITCDNETSLEWLRNTVPALSKPWEGARLDVVGMDQLPRLTKATVLIPGEPEYLQLLARCMAWRNA